MTNRLALLIGAAVLAALFVDHIWADGRATLFVARKLLDLLDYLAFWR